MAAIHKTLDRASSGARPCARALLQWYEKNKRDLPWRRPCRPYAVLVSEVMLQQTQVDTVVPYYERWMARFGDLARLAEASQDDVLSEWQGLGYYSRARALHACARELTRRGQDELPGTTQELVRLPGIGRYTAAAVASIAFGRDEPVVDGNVIRVLTRVFALDGDPTKNPLRDELWRLAAELLPAGRAGDFNQALMELGALVCRPKQPRCRACPWRRRCRAHASGREAEYPKTRARPPVQNVRAAAAVLNRGGTLLLVQAPRSAARWAGLWMLPQVELGPGESGQAGAARALRECVGIAARSTARLGALKHSVTRFRIALEWHRMSNSHARPRPGPGVRVEFCNARRLRELAMPAAHRSICSALMP